MCEQKKKRKAHRTQIFISENRANSNISLAYQVPTTSSTGCSASTEQPVDEVVNKEHEPGHSYVNLWGYIENNEAEILNTEKVTKLT